MNRLFILCGIPFSGKSTLAKALVEKLGCTRIDLDDIKFKLLGKHVIDEEIEQNNWDVIYQEMYKQIQYLLKEGKTVINDTGNFTKYERKLVRQIADRLNIPTNTIYLDIPRPLAYDRLVKNRETKERFDVSDVAFENAVKEMEPPTDDENPLVYHYGDLVEDWIQNNLMIEAHSSN